MLAKRMAVISNRGDTLIEVTVALAILSMVLASSAALATTAFRAGQTARERTQLVEQAQEQLEALHSFRDNHTWPQFQHGDSTCTAGGNCVGIEGNILTSACAPIPGFNLVGKKCFYMRRGPNAAPTGWVPWAGSLTNATPDANSTQLTVPTSVMEITLADETQNFPLTKNCGYDFVLYYYFYPVGQSQAATNDIKVRLTNLKYTPQPGGCPTA
jgi:prepilin-type N-terminal cleavage/methylation domain-containing protein